MNVVGKFMFDVITFFMLFNRMSPQQCQKFVVIFVFQCFDELFASFWKFQSTNMSSKEKTYSLDWQCETFVNKFWPSLARKWCRKLFKPSLLAIRSSFFSLSSFKAGPIFSNWNKRKRQHCYLKSLFLIIRPEEVKAFDYKSHLQSWVFDLFILSRSFVPNFAMVIL